MLETEEKYKTFVRINKPGLHGFQELHKVVCVVKLFFCLFFSIRPFPGLLPVLGPLERYMTPTLDMDLLSSSRASDFNSQHLRHVS